MQQLFDWVSTVVTRYLWESRIGILTALDRAVITKKKEYMEIIGAKVEFFDYLNMGKLDYTTLISVLMFIILSLWSKNKENVQILISVLKLIKAMFPNHRTSTLLSGNWAILWKCRTNNIRHCYHLTKFTWIRLF